MALAANKNEIPPDRQAEPPSINEGVDVGEYLALPDEDDDDPEFVDVPGGQLVTIGDRTEGKEPTPSEGFYENLALKIPEEILERVATDLLKKIDEDKEARKKRDEQYEEGIRRTGLGKDAPGGAEFEGSSRAVHPMLTEACIDYESRIIKEIYPPSGPVKPKIIGTVTQEKEDRAKRKTEHMNWQITSQIKEARAVLETTLTQVPLGGSQFIRQTWDHRMGRPRWRFVPIDQVYLPYSAENFASAHRKTYAEPITALELQQRVEQGQYRDLDLPTASMMPEKSKAGKANEKIEGLEDPGMNVDGDRIVFEVATLLEVTPEMAAALDHEEPKKLYPYLWSIDEQSKKVLAVYRLWEEHDPGREPIEHLFEFPFIPWRGAYSIGFPQIIGGLSSAATGALRALLDTAFIQNSAGGYILKGTGAGGQTRRPNPTELTELDGGLEADDIRKRVLPNSALANPSPVLLQLLGIVVDAAKGTVRTSLDETAVNTNSNVPVGTQLSRVEEGLVVFSAIHGRIHVALNSLLAGLHRLNRLYLPEVLRVDGEGREIMVRRKDYDGPCDIQPVSDPTIFSDLQRSAQYTEVQQLATMFPNVFKLRKLIERRLKLWKIPDPGELLVDEPQPHELNAVNESLSLALGKPVVAFPDQDHLAHIQVHLDFTKSPMLGGNPLIAPKYLPGVLQHLIEHIAYFYAQTMVDTVEAASGQRAVDLMSNDPEIKRKFDQLLAQTSQNVIPKVEAAIKGAMPIIQQAMAMMQQLAPKPPVDPGIAMAAQTEMAETSRKTQADQAKAQSDQERNAIQAERNQITEQNAESANRTKLATTEMDNQAARDIATTRLTEGHSSGFTTGSSLIGH